MTARDAGNRDPLCRYCRGSVMVPRYSDGRAMPWWYGTERETAARFHESARCVEGPEPSRAMGGPA